MKYQDLVDEAFEAMKDAYAPYSNYHVGACLLTRDGRRFRGVNIENSSYGATNCAERSAIFGAYSYGYRKQDIEAIAIVTDGNTLGAPCGICRQVMADLLESDTPILLANTRGDHRETNISELLPFAFTDKDLH